MKSLVWQFDAHHPSKDGLPFNTYIIWPGPRIDCILPALSRVEEICRKILGSDFLHAQIYGTSMLSLSVDKFRFEVQLLEGMMKDEKIKEKG